MIEARENTSFHAMHIHLSSLRVAPFLIPPSSLPLFIISISCTPPSLPTALGVYCFVGFMMDVPTAAVSHLLGMRLVPPFDRPFLSIGLAEFWGRRWNIPISCVLR